MNEFQPGDVVILKSEQYKENPLLMTVNKVKNATIAALYNLNGEVKREDIIYTSLIKWTPKASTK